MQSAKCMIFCLKIEEFLLFLTCCFKFTTIHESKFASTCKMCSPNTCKTVLCSGNQFPVKIHIFLFFNFVPLFMELPNFVYFWQSIVKTCVFSTLSSPRVLNVTRPTFYTMYDDANMKAGCFFRPMYDVSSKEMTIIQKNPHRYLTKQ